MSKLLDKFRGTLVGALAGDCLGGYFEGRSCVPMPLKEIKDFIYKKVQEAEKGSINYSDDAAMTFVICKSLIEKQGFDDEHMAYEFCEEYYRDSGRGYGQGVVEVFRKLKYERPDDFRQPAKEQFDGTGSYGNGAAMRISPIALFSKDTERLHEYARRCAVITHTHINGVNGAIIQAQAVFNALKTDPPNLDTDKYIDDLAEVAHVLEEKAIAERQDKSSVDISIPPSHPSSSTAQIFPYESKIKEMKTLLSSANSVTAEKVVETFGNGIRAEEAVLAAIFAFLFKGRESVEEAIIYAISLGGDTDTIGTMAGAISGAYLGLKSIPDLWKDKCEETSSAIKFADEIFKLGEQSNVHNKV